MRMHDPPVINSWGKYSRFIFINIESRFILRILDYIFIYFKNVMILHTLRILKNFDAAIKKCIFAHLINTHNEH
jgi:hypothetical protein